MVLDGTQQPRRRSAHARQFGRLTALLATAALIAFPAQAAGTVIAPVTDDGCGIRPLDVVILMDRSGSMGNESRLVFAKQAANGLIADLNANGGVGGSGRHQVGLTKFGGTTATVDVALGSGASAATVTGAVNALTASGNTPTRTGMAAAAADMLAGDRGVVDGLQATQVLIFLSDGKPNPAGTQTPNAGEIASFQAAADQVFTIALGSGGSGVLGVDPAFMASIAKPNDASHAYHVTSSGDLPNIFALIYDQIACTPGIAVVKTASATDLPVGGGSVTFTYAVTNTGQAALSSVGVSDDKCSPVTFVGGDADTDGKLDLSETFTYTCTTAVTTTTKNVATATGSYDGTTVQATDDVTVNVALPTQPPVTEPPVTQPPVTEPPTLAPEITPTPAPSGTVLAETSRPRVTPPPTDASIDGSTGSGSVPIILGLLAIIALAMSVRPASLRNRSR